MATAEEILEAMAAAEEEQVLVIDNDLRTIEIPGTVNLLGVESDEEVKRIRFRMPRMCGEFDLSEFVLRINYKNAAGKPDAYPVDDETVIDDVIEFSWLVGRFATQQRGSVSFSVCAKKFDGEEIVKEFNTIPAKLPVLEGLEADPAIVQEYPDVVESILKRLGELESNTGSLPNASGVSF